MGGVFLNFLGGLGESAEKQRKKNEADAAREIDQQQSVYKVLLGSSDPEIQAIGLAGLLEPPKKSVFGKLKTSPTYEQALQLIHRGRQHEGTSASPPPPPKPGAAGMPDVPPMTGGGGNTGPAAGSIAGLPSKVTAGQEFANPPQHTPQPGAPGSVFALGDIGATPEVQEATSPAGSTPLPPAPPAPPEGLGAPPPQQGPAPQQVVQSFLGGVKSHEEALKKLQEIDPYGLSAAVRPLRTMIQSAQAVGIPWEQTVEGIGGQIFPKTLEAQTREEVAKMRAAAMLGKPRPGKVVYDTVGNKKVAKLIDSATGETIKPNLSSQEIALGHVAVNNPDGSQTLVQFSNMPGGGGSASGAAPGSAKPIPPGSTPGEKKTSPPPAAPAPSGPAGINLGFKPLQGQERSRAQAASAALESTVQIQKMLKDPKVAAALGPLAGRATTFEQLIGSIPPEMTKLKSALEGYALNTMGVHGMRSAQEAHELINKNLPTKFSPEALIASLEGLNEVPLSWASKLPPPPKEQRVVGRTTMVIRGGPDAGKIGVWNGQGWVPWTP